MKLLVLMVYAIATVVTGVSMAMAGGVECAIVALFHCLVTFKFAELMQK